MTSGMLFVDILGTFHNLSTKALLNKYWTNLKIYEDNFS